MIGGRADRGRAALTGAVEGIVVAVLGPSSCELRLAAVNGDVKYRAIVLEGPWTLGLLTQPATVAGGEHAHMDTRGDYSAGGSHAHAPHAHLLGRPLAVGDRVLAVFLHGRDDTPIVVGRIPRL